MKQFSEDKVKVNDGFWRTLEKLGASRQAIAKHTQLPTAVLLNKVAPTTAQFFAIWDALPQITHNPEVGFEFVRTIKMSQLPPELFAASLAKDYRSALNRVCRFKGLCAPEQLALREDKSVAVISIEWLKQAEVPDCLVDTTFSFLLALGRDNAEQPIEIVSIELQRPSSPLDLASLFSAPVHFGCAKNEIVIKAVSLDVRFETYNQGLSDLLIPQLETALSEQHQSHKYSDQVKWIIEQFLSAGSPAITDVAKELGVSVRTLQRRITDEGQTFKGLLNIVRLDMAKQYLLQEGMSLNEIAALLGYDDQNSFYRAFKQLEGETPSNWRDSHSAPV